MVLCDEHAGFLYILSLSESVKNAHLFYPSNLEHILKNLNLFCSTCSESNRNSWEHITLRKGDTISHLES